MTRLQNCLLVILILEVIGLGILWKRGKSPGNLPPVNWSGFVIEDATVAEIRLLESKLNRKNPASWGELAATYRAFGLFKQADYCYRQVGKLAPVDRSYLYYWAECLDLMGHTRQATRLYEKILQENLISPLGELTPDYCWLNIGQNRLREENVPAALEAFRQAGRLPKAKFLLARQLIRLGQAQESSSLLDDLLRQSPGNLEFNQMKSWAEAALGHVRTASDYSDRSLRSTLTLPKWDPTFEAVQRRRQQMGSQAWHEQSVELKMQRKLREALALSRKALDAFWTEDRLQNHAELELLSGRFQEAISAAEQSVQRVGASAKTLDIIGVASIQLGRRAEAIQAWTLAVQFEPTINLYGKLAEMDRQAGNQASVRRWQGLAEFQAGKDSWQRNDLAPALQHLQKSIELIDSHAPTWFYLGETRRALGDAEAAGAAYRRCLEINPDHGRAIERLARAIP